MELGGKNATVVFADCDFEQTVVTCVRSSFANQGQICLCGSRIFVEEDIYEKFVQAFVKQVRESRPEAGRQAGWQARKRAGRSETQTDRHTSRHKGTPQHSSG